jgi:hypothetical protein
MNQTSIAVLGILAEFHREGISYDLSELVEMVRQINPDLLCLDITMQQWQQQTFGDLPREYAEALLPLAYQTDIVVAPIAGGPPVVETAVTGWRASLNHRLRRWLAWIQETASSPAALNQGWRHDLGNKLYDFARRLAGDEVQQAYHQHIQQLAQAVIETAERNPGNRILVVVNIQYCHHIRPLLQQTGLQLTSYNEL